MVHLGVAMLVVGVVITILYFILTITVIGVVLVPFIGLAIGIFLFFTMPLMLEKDMAAFDAIKASIDKVKGAFGACFLPIFLAMLVAGVFALITGPWMMIANWMIYDAAYDGPATADAE